MMYSLELPRVVKVVAEAEVEEARLVVATSISSCFIASGSRKNRCSSTNCSKCESSSKEKIVEAESVEEIVYSWWL